MTQAKGVFQEILAHQNRSESCMLVSAVGGSGSAPRKVQSHMLVNQSGYVCGTVGGGAVEGNSITYAKKLLETQESGLKTFELYEQAAEDIGMICGGRVNVHFRWIACDDHEMQQIAQAVVAALEAGRDAWLIIDLFEHTFSLYDGMSQLGHVFSDEIISCLTSEAFCISFDDLPVYAEQISYGDRVYIFGGGHVAQALVPMLSSVDFRCIVIEDREEFCKKSLFPKAQDVLLLREDEWNTALNVGCNDCICIMTRGHINDLSCQAFALKTQASYIGVIGSRRKVAAVNAHLRGMGFDDAQLARIITPIGLEIGAVTPAEIAVSITAQMIAHRASKRKEEIKKSCMA